MSADVLTGALADEPSYFFCCCTQCVCLRDVDRPEGVCPDCELGNHDEPEFGGEG